MHRLAQEQEWRAEDEELAAKEAAELKEKLEAWRDPKDGEQVVLRMFRGSEAYQGLRTAEGPDMIVGYNRGYGCSDESTFEGKVELIGEEPWCRPATWHERFEIVVVSDALTELFTVEKVSERRRSVDDLIHAGATNMA